MNYSYYKISDNKLELVNVADIAPPLDFEVQIRHTHIEMNFYDIDIIRGLIREPNLDIPGICAIGIIEELGAKALHSGWYPGDRVGYCTARNGAFSTKRNINPDILVSIPENMDSAAAAALLRTGVMSHMLLRRVYVAEPENHILMFNPTGALGHIFAQLASSLGCNVIAVTRNLEKKRPSLESLNAFSLLIDNEDSEFTKKIMKFTKDAGIHAVFDTIGDKNLSKSVDVMQYCSIFVSLGQNSGSYLSVSLQRAMKKSIFITRPSLFDYKAFKNELRITWLDVCKSFEAFNMQLNITTHKFHELPKVYQSYLERKTDFSNIITI